LKDWQPKKKEKQLFVQFEYMQYKTAKDWGKTPSEWRLLSKNDKTIMMAFDRAEGMIESWHSEEMEKRMDAKTKSKGKQKDRNQGRKHVEKRR